MLVTDFDDQGKVEGDWTGEVKLVKRTLGYLIMVTYRTAYEDRLFSKGF